MNERGSKSRTWRAQEGAFKHTSKTVAPQAIETDVRGSNEGGLFSSEEDIACMS